MGHISIGLELVNSLWRKTFSENSAAWKDLVPASEDVRLHLLHLIGAHHGEPEFGSPVSPKTPEAMALHYIDNLDARLEMFAAGYKQQTLAARIFDRVRPLGIWSNRSTNSHPKRHRKTERCCRGRRCVWVAHASRVLVAAPRRNDLSKCGQLTERIFRSPKSPQHETRALPSTSAARGTSARR